MTLSNSDQELPNSPIFVVGAPRSGTTLLGRALGASSDCAYLEETGMFALYGARRFPSIWARHLNKIPGFHFNSLKQRALAITDRLRGRDRLHDAVKLMFRHRHLKKWDLKPSGPLVEVQNTSPSPAEDQSAIEFSKRLAVIARKHGPKDVIAAYFNEFLSHHPGKRLLGKTPDHIAFIPVILDLFPDARIVLIRREKKDTIASYIRTFGLNSNLHSHILTKKYLVRDLCKKSIYYEKIEQLMESKTWCHIIDYNDLIEKPVSTLMKACNWLCIKMDETLLQQMCSPRKSSSQWDDLSPELQKEIETNLTKYYGFF